MQDLTIALVQCDLIWENKTTNLHHLSKLIQNLQNIDLVILPEMFPTAFSMKPEHFAEKIDGPSFKWMKNKAIELNSAICGSMMIEENSKYYNRFFIVKPDGSYTFYDKRHPFRMGGEHQHFEYGTEKVIFELKGWKIKPLICYDLRFPVWAKNNYKNQAYEYDVLLTVANWPSVRSFVWKTLLSSRAIENQSYSIGVNRIGADGNGLEHSGDSNVYDAKGVAILAERPNQEFVEVMTLSYNELYDFREKFTVGLDWDEFDIRMS